QIHCAGFSLKRLARVLPTMLLILRVLMPPPFCHRRAGRSAPLVQWELDAEHEHAVAHLGACAAAPRLDHAGDEREPETGAAIRLRHAGRWIAPIGQELLWIAVRRHAGGPYFD